MWQRNARIYDGQVKIEEHLHLMVREDVRTRVVSTSDADITPLSTRKDSC
jgi:hypothetical protein